MKYLIYVFSILLFLNLIVCKKKEFNNPVDPVYQEEMINIHENKNITISESTEYTVELNDGSKIIIPKNAVDTGCEINIKRGINLVLIPSTKIGQQLGDMFLISLKNGFIRRPLILEMPFDKTNVNYYNPSRIKISKYSNGRWNPIKSVLLNNENGVSSQITEENWYSIINWANEFISVEGFNVLPAVIDNINSNNLNITNNPKYEFSINDTAGIDAVKINFRFILKSQITNEKVTVLNSIFNSPGIKSDYIEFKEIDMTVRPGNIYNYILNLQKLNTDAILADIDKILGWVTVTSGEIKIESETVDLTFFETSKPKIHLILPGNMKNVGTTPLFKWEIENLSTSYSGLSLFVDTDNPFKPGLDPVITTDDMAVNQSRISIENSLPNGIYYWGIILDGGSEEIKSEIGSFIAGSNNPPDAKLQIDITSGKITTDFVFDGSKSSDDNDSLQYLRFRWDWENDGSWDTDYSFENVITHRFDGIGNFSIRMEVSDTELLSSFDTVDIFIEDTAPVVTITAPSESQSGKIKIDFSVSDSDGNKNDFLVYYNENNSVYRLLTIDSVKQGNIETTYGKPSKLSGVSSGNNYFIWDSNSEIVYENTENVKILFKWIDTYDTGELPDGIESGSFTVNNFTDFSPVPSFTVSPSSGVTNYTFTFDVSATTDNEDLLSELLFRWDWDGNGTWDTAYGSGTTYYHSFNSQGNYSVVLEVKDSAGNTAASSLDLTVESNSPPSVGITSPENEAVFTSGTNILFSADVLDPDGENINSSSILWTSSITGTFASGNSVYFSSLTAGEHTIIIKVTDNWGAYTMDTVSITIESGEEGGMLLISAGEFTMGDGSDNAPYHNVYLDAYYIDKYEITNSEFASFLNDGNESCYNSYMKISLSDTGYAAVSGFERHPVIFVSWNGASAYAQWAGKRLPTEAEWEKAARGYSVKAFPWGWEIDGSYANYKNSGDPFESNRFSTTPVGYYNGTNRDGYQTLNGESPFGIHDMAGNVWEWVSDWYSEDYYNSSGALNNPRGPAGGSKKVIRGGSWANYDIQIRTGYRYYSSQTLKNSALGFRCAKDIE